MAKQGEFRPRKHRRSIRQESADVADWQSADPQLLQRAIERAAFFGGAIRFGYSSDGGAYAVGIYFDGDMHTEFVRPSEDLDDFLRQVAEWYESEAEAKISADKAARNGDSSAKGTRK